MAGITLAQAEAQLAAWLAASEAVARNQSYRIGERQLTRADAGEVLRQVTYWDGRVQALAAAATGQGRVRQAVPL
ncbi:hypothetical protein STVA_41540 [Allostella vacuolata]|nr:hypothetical protein STVA_41540 [Stella vacuolata]